MNPTKLVEMIKLVAKEKLIENHFQAGYSRSLSMRGQRYKPNVKQLAEIDKKKENKSKGSSVTLYPEMDNLAGPPMGSKTQSSNI